VTSRTHSQRQMSLSIACLVANAETVTFSSLDRDFRKPSGHDWRSQFSDHQQTGSQPPAVLFNHGSGGDDEVVKRWRQHAAGALLCILAAGVLAFSFHGSGLQNLLPFLFIAVISFVAVRFGSAVGIVGTLGAASIFAEFLFKPIWTLAIVDSAQRRNLIWMTAPSPVWSARLCRSSRLR
jgi:hypothetical protein